MHINVNPNAIDIEGGLQTVLAAFPYVHLALVFGSVAQGCARQDSDLDIALAARQPLTQEQKMSLISALAVHTGRPVDMIDLNTVGAPLLSQIIKHGRRVVGSASEHGRWISRHLTDEADFMPLRNRVLQERRNAWIGK